MLKIHAFFWKMPCKWQMFNIYTGLSENEVLQDTCVHYGLLLYHFLRSLRSIFDCKSWVHTIFRQAHVNLLEEKTWNNMKHLENLPVQISVLCLPVFSHEKGSKGRGVFSFLAHFFASNPCHAMRLMVLAMGQMCSDCFFHGHARLACSQTCAATRWVTWVNKELKWPNLPLWAIHLQWVGASERIISHGNCETSLLESWKNRKNRMCLICYWKASRV